MITLSAGLFGGETIEWTAQGTVGDGREYMQIEDHIYVKVSDIQAVFYGLV